MIVHAGRVKCHPSSFIGQYLQRRIGLAKETHEDGYFTLDTLSKEAQAVSITDCQAGNPCEISSDLTDEIYLPMIEGLYGYD
ncbi:hypothetical protein Tco_1414955, partial [Tanacetum coccineum]